MPRPERGFSHPTGCAMMTSLRDSERYMPAITLRIPPEDVFEFNDYVSAWSTTSGIDPKLAVAHQMQTTNESSPIMYSAFVDERFFEQYPRWRQFLEHRLSVGHYLIPARLISSRSKCIKRCSCPCAPARSPLFATFLFV